MVHKAIDREKNPFFHIRFDVVDEQTGQTVDRTLAFDVAIKDINDNYPHFEHLNMKVSVKENVPQGGLPVNLQAFDSDEDGNDNSRVTMTIISQEPASPKFILQTVPNTKMQQLTFNGCFDYDKEKTYKVIVEAKDHGKPPLSSSTTITLDITDANTHQPVFTETKYATEVPEMETKEILRIKVTDGDAPDTPASRPVFKILKGNEDGNYMIETDPKTKEGVLRVVKGKDFERTEIVNLEIAVENEEPLFVCKDGVPGDRQSVPPQTVTVEVQVVDVNDPPLFEKPFERVFEKEEVPPGRKLYRPRVSDEDSDLENIRYKLIDDPEKWLSIDEKTGVVTTVKAMDRESPNVHKSVYTVHVLAIDDGKPPATGTSTLHIVLGDINDNLPHLVTKNTILCSEKNDVHVRATDFDEPPYGGPFSFSFAGDNANELKKKWKLHPTTGENTTLISLTVLDKGNHTIQLLIEDQQGKRATDELNVFVCDCGGGDECRGLLPISTQLSGPAIGALLAGLLLLFLLLLLCFLCECGARDFKHIPLNMADEGHQTLIKYNEEGGGTACKAEPVLVRSPTTYITTTTVTDGLKQAAVPLPQVSSSSLGLLETQETTKTMRSQTQGMYSTQYSTKGFQQASMANNTLRSTGRSMQQTWNSTMQDSMRNGFTRPNSLVSERYIADHIDRKVYQIGDEEFDPPEYSLHVYEYEGNGSRCQSLDQLSFDNYEEDLDVDLDLQDLGPSFRALGGICQRHMQEKDIAL
ncbi:hypothetical protein ACEWY4_000504 [Coilia grayii]|uniref:Cadherin domain-containing protein n=1 Tax=Coilia grayii TaxID=363190 RepID=A0ABD1KXD6_9TELE